MPASMDGAWVGTWRPHRPRGLISAQFPSPGPQYSIPGTTGYVGHSPTKARAPGAAGPGPATLWSPPSPGTGSTWAPGAQLRGRPATKTTVTPGPSEYHLCSTSPRQDERAARFARGTLTLPLAHTLSAAPPAGPGTYTLPRLMGPNTVYTSASPCYSVRGRSQRGRFDEDLAKVSSAAPLFRVSIRTWAAPPVPQGLPSLLQLCLTQTAGERESLECDPSPVWS
uniref:ODF3A protein n=1 Tax=Gallus gallus TaxID=9031 RepID=A0A8V1ANU6_CHICK